MQTDQQPFFDVGAYTDPGKTRRENDDSFLVADRHGKLLVVADGISGAGAATMASNLAVETLARHLAERPPPDEAGDEAITAELRAALLHCQRAIRQAAAERGLASLPIGSSVTLAYIVWPDLHIAHAGDSRAYVWSHQRLERLTTDDTLARQLIEHEVLEPGESNRWEHVLTNAVGGESDELAVEYHHRVLEPGDRVLLCTNGLTRYVDDLEIGEALRSAVTAATASRRLAGLAIDRGGADNVTVVIAHANPRA